MHRKYKLLIQITLISVLLDQITKYLVFFNFKLGESVKVIDGFFNLTYVMNPGAAFGFLADYKGVVVTTFFICVSIIALIVIFLSVKHSLDHEKILQLALSLVFSGALGNLIDRIIHHEVIDFLDVYWGTYHWPAFNVADSAISIGMCFLIYYIFYEIYETSFKKKDAVKGNGS